MSESSADTETDTTVDASHPDHPYQNRVGPVVITQPALQGQLMDEGRLIMYRPDEERTTGETHARWHPKGDKQMEVTIEHLTPCSAVVDTTVLAAAQPFSGFETVREWKLGIKESVRSTYPRDGHLYLVERRTEGSVP